MTHNARCYDCRFFAPGTWGCSTEVFHEELGKKYDASNIGQCRKNTPREGITLRCDHDIPAKWPRVYAGDWCGEFQPRHTDADKSPHDAPLRNENDASMPNAHSGA